MTRMLVAVSLAAAALGACKKSAKPDCDGAGKAIEAAAADVAKNGKDELARETAKRVGPATAASVVLRCKEDGWSAAATDCVKSAKAGHLTECESKLTKDQAEKFKTSVAAIEGTAGGAGDPNAVAPAAPAGPPADCAALEAVMTRAWNDQVAAAQNDADRKAAEAKRVQARSEVAKRCTDDRWSAEAVDCFKATTSGDFAACKAKLTPMQASAVETMVPASAAPAAPAAPEGSAAAPAEGSATGSAE